MKAICLGTLFSILVLQNVCLSQNSVSNGDFENDFAGWTPVEDVSISTTTVHSGAKALMVSDPTQTRFAYVYRKLVLDYGTDEITFWVYPASATYYNFFELIANWQPGPAIIITRVTLRDNLIGFTAVDTTETIANVLTPNSWNKVTIQVNSATLTQDFYINDILYSSLTTSAFPKVEHLLVGDLSGSGNYGTLFYDDVSITGTGSIACPFQGDPLLAIEDETFSDADWVSEIIVNSAAPANPWVLDIAFQTFDTRVVHYPPAGNPPPGRWVRYTYNGEGDQGATVEAASWFAQSIVPAPGGLQAIQLDFDTWGSGQRLGPMILQDGTYYRGPTFILERSADWLAYSSGCLTVEDFEKRVGPGPDRPDFSLPMVVGYSLSNTTNTTFGLHDHLIDNFRVFVAGNFTLSNPPPVSNRPPFAINDFLVADLAAFNTYIGSVDALLNDVDPDGDALTVTGVTPPTFGMTEYHETDGFVFYNSFSDPPINSDGFRYTVSDGEFTDEAQVFVLMDNCTLGPVSKISQADSLDLDLIRRFRDEVMKPTVDGARYVDYYYNTATEILKILILDRPDLRDRAVTMVEILQPAIRNVLDGDGSSAITQAQMDTVANFFTDLSAAGSAFLQQLISDELVRLGPLSSYVGQPVKSVLATVLGDSIATGIADENETVPRDFVLQQNFPNPFNPTTQISYTLSRASEVELIIYNIQGQTVKTLVKEFQTAGQKSLAWDGLDDRGVAVMTGLYFFQLRAGGFHQTKKMILMK